MADEARFGLDEVPIGIPMPAVYVRLLAHAWGGPLASRACLLGEIFAPDQAHALGMVQELLPAEELTELPAAMTSDRARHAHAVTGNSSDMNSPLVGKLRQVRRSAVLLAVVRRRRGWTAGAVF